MLSTKGHNVPIISTITVAEAFGSELPNDRFLLLYGFQLWQDASEDTLEGWIEAPVGVRMTGPGLALMDSVRNHPEQFPPAIVDTCQASEVAGNVLAVDYDLPGHGEWTQELIGQVETTIVGASINCPLIAAPSVAYKTKGGFRLVWFLSRPIPIEGARGLKDLLPGLVATLHIAGVHVDPTCRDWTRLFRLPRVMREVERDGVITKVPTSQQTYMAQSWNRVDFSANEPVPGDGMVLVYPPEAFKGISEFTLDHPRLRECHTLLAKYEGIIGHVPQHGSRASTAAVGTQPANDFISQVMSGSGAGEYIHKSQIRKWVGAASKVSSKNHFPPAHATTAQLHLFGNALLVSQENPDEAGQLHEGITRAAISVMRTLRKELASGSAHLPTIYALLLQNARNSNKIRQRPRADDILAAEVWSVVTWAFRAEMGVYEDELEQERAEQERAQDAAQVQTHSFLAEETLIKQALGRMIEKDPRQDPKAPPSPDQYRWLLDTWKQMLVLDVPGRGNAVLRLRPDGHFAYGDPLEGFKRLLTSVRDCRHHHITTMEGKSEKDNGKTPTRLEFEILRDYSTPVKYHRMSRLIQSHLATIRFECGDPIVTFVEALPALKQSIQPRYDPDVDEWLRGLGGVDHEDLFNWLAAFWDLSRPATMLHIKGDSDCGKSLLVKALKECTESGIAAPIADMFGDFQDLALLTPLLFADEENTSTSKTARSTINVLKKLATGEANTINSKGKAAVQIEGYWRVIMVENDRRMLQFQEDMTKVDREALMKRLLCVEADSAACRSVIDRMGGRSGLDEWIRYKIPEHVRWISKQRELSRTDRVLAMSRVPQDNLNIGTNTMSKVIAALGEMLEDKMKYGAQYWLKEDAVVIKPKTLRAVMQDAAKERGTQMPAPQSFAETMRTLCGDKGMAMSVKLSVNHSVWAFKIPLQEILPRIHQLGEHLNIRESLGEDIWMRLVPESMRKDFDEALEMPVHRRGPVAEGIAGSRSLGEGMRAAATAAKNGHANGHTNGHNHLPTPSVMAMGPSALFSAASLVPPPPPTQN